MLHSVGLTRKWHRKLNIQILSRGLLSGTVAVSGVCAVCETWEAFVVGVVGGVLGVNGEFLSYYVRLFDSKPVLHHSGGL